MMLHLIRAEWSKIWTVRGFRAILAIAIVYPLLGLIPAMTAPEAERAVADSYVVFDSLKSGAQVAAFAMLVLGILAGAGEFRHGTIVPSLLASPRRSRYFMAKVATLSLTGAVVGILSSIVSIAAAAVYVGSAGAGLGGVGTGDVALAIGGVVLVSVLYGAMGAGIGGAVRNQTVAVAGALMWFYLVEKVVPIVLRDPGLSQWLPGGAADQLYQLATPSPELLAGWAAAITLTAVVAVIGSAALIGTVRADL